MNRAVTGFSTLKFESFLSRRVSLESEASYLIIYITVLISQFRHSSNGPFLTNYRQSGIDPLSLNKPRLQPYCVTVSPLLCTRILKMAYLYSQILAVIAIWTET